MTPARLFDIARLRLRSWLRRQQVDRDLDRELHFHLDQQIAEYVARGLSPDEARVAAMQSLGGVAQVAEACRDQRRTRHMVALLAIITTACACYLPARRATRADPMDSLRAD